MGGTACEFYEDDTATAATLLASCNAWPVKRSSAVTLHGHMSRRLLLRSFHPAEGCNTVRQAKIPGAYPRHTS